MVLTGNQIRQSFLDFFVQRGHTLVPSASLVPGGDGTLLFTNAGMVQFKDVFLGTDARPYTRAVDSQKCMRVSGKHNDLDTVGRDDTHHTFFEMLGNWSFGDYYKKEAIAWSWELLTRVWGLDPKRLYATFFVDEKGLLPSDEEARAQWLAQPGFEPAHLITGNRKDNFWEMAETGPCGPCTEIHYDFGPEACRMAHLPGHVCEVNGDCGRIIEIWNNVFIQYNRLSPTEFKPLPRQHVDTGMGFERIVAALQGVRSNYETDLLKPLLDETQRIAKQTDAQRAENLTPYRVIADHVRSASFLIADGVIPGNIGRNYVCRMIIRRGARFGRKLNLTTPFMAQVARKVVENYREAYPEIGANAELIYETLTREEERFAETLDAGFAELDRMIQALQARGEKTLDGKSAFNLYATLGFPLEITRDILGENGFEVDEKGFYASMEEHRSASGKGSVFTEGGKQNTELYETVLSDLRAQGLLGAAGVLYDPYSGMSVNARVLALFVDGQAVKRAEPGQKVEVLLDRTPFYIEAGGQTGDTGSISSLPAGNWQLRADGVQRVAAGVIVHHAEVLSGTVQLGDEAFVQVDPARRRSIMRNHTATHLLHAALRHVLGDKLHQAGSAVDAERLRFDFNYPQAVKAEQLLQIEAFVNAQIQGELPVMKTTKSLDEARAEGAMALFGEKYGSEVRTIEMCDGSGRVSYELCGGTHVDNSSEIGSFYIVSESSVASGVRRIEAVSGAGAYAFARERISLLNELSAFLETSSHEALGRIRALSLDLRNNDREIEQLRMQLANASFDDLLSRVETFRGVPYLAANIPNANVETLRNLADRFRQEYPGGLVVLATVVQEKPALIASVTPELIARGLKAGDLIKRVAAVVGGGGGGRPDLAQAGGKDPAKLAEALDQVIAYLREQLPDAKKD